MRLNAKLLALIIISFVTLVLIFSINSAEANDQNTQTIIAEKNNKKIDEISKSLSEINEKLKRIDGQPSSWAEISNVKKELRELDDSIQSNKKYTIDSASNSLNNLISLNSYIISIVGVMFAALAFFGYTSIKTMKQEITKDAVKEVINHMISDYKPKVDQVFINEAANLRDEVNEELRDLSETVDDLRLQLNQLIDNNRTHPPSKQNAPITKATTPVKPKKNKPSSGNAFDQ